MTRTIPESGMPYQQKKQRTLKQVGDHVQDPPDGRFLIAPEPVGLLLSYYYAGTWGRETRTGKPLDGRGRSLPGWAIPQRQTRQSRPSCARRERALSAQFSAGDWKLSRGAVVSSQSGCDRRLIQALLRQTCTSIQWHADTDTSITDRIEIALAAHGLHIQTPEVDLHARLTREFALAIAVRVRIFDDDAEASLDKALCQDKSLMAEFVKAQWQLVRTACRAAERTAGTLVLLTTLPEA